MAWLVIIWLVLALLVSRSKKGEEGGFENKGFESRLLERKRRREHRIVRFAAVTSLHPKALASECVVLRRVAYPFQTWRR